MGFDVFNALNLMENKEFLEKLKFGNLQCYLYNWRCPQMNPHQVGLAVTPPKPQPTLPQAPKYNFDLVHGGLVTNRLCGAPKLILTR